MTPAEAEALGRRWIAAGGGWRDGMLAGGGHPRRTLFGSSQSGSTYGYALPLPKNKRGVQLRPPCPPLDPKAWPDLRDPATRGAALEVVRERWGDPTAYVRYSHEWKSWYAYAGTWCPVGGAHDSEEAALVAALEAALRP